MRARLKLTALLWLGLAAFAAPASAAPLDLPGPYNHAADYESSYDPADPLVAGNTYQAAFGGSYDIPFPGANENGGVATGAPYAGHYYAFKTGATGITIEVQLTSSTVSDTSLSLFETVRNGDEPGSPLSAISLVNNAGVLTAVFVLEAGKYYALLVQGVGDVYQLALTATPIPPALLLFGTALAGLTWLSRRRRLPLGRA